MAGPHSRDIFKNLVAVRVMLELMTEEARQ